MTPDTYTSPPNSIPALGGPYEDSLCKSWPLFRPSLAKARDGAYARHAADLAQNIDEASFVTAFGAPKSELASLVANKTATLPLLLKLSPEGTADPSPFLYNDVFYGLAGCSALALACNVAAFKMPIHGRRG